MFDDQKPKPATAPSSTWEPMGRQVTGCTARPAPGTSADFRYHRCRPCRRMPQNHPFVQVLECFKAPNMVVNWVFTFQSTFKPPRSSSVQMVLRSSSHRLPDFATPPDSSRAAAVSQHSQLQVLPATASPWWDPACLMVAHVQILKSWSIMIHPSSSSQLGQPWKKMIPESRSWISFSHWYTCIITYIFINWNKKIISLRKPSSPAIIPSHQLPQPAPGPEPPVRGAALWCPFHVAFGVKWLQVEGG